MEVCCAVPATPMMKAQKAVPATHLRIKSSRNRDYPFLFRPIYFKAAEQSSGLVGDDHVVEKPLHNKTVTQIKASLNLALQGINRGIFGVPSEKKSEIEGLVELLESQNPTTNPTQNLEKVSGCWKLVYSTITILGPKRTKLGLRDFITLGDFLQIIDVSELMNLFQKNYDLLVSIFNPDGWLEISYVDESMRIGRDDKGNIFVLIRSEDK